jgi:hypothetical protein
MGAQRGTAALVRVSGDGDTVFQRPSVRRARACRRRVVPVFRPIRCGLGVGPDVRDQAVIGNQPDPGSGAAPAEAGRSDRRLKVVTRGRQNQLVEGGAAQTRIGTAQPRRRQPDPFRNRVGNRNTGRDLDWLCTLVRSDRFVIFYHAIRITPVNRVRWFRVNCTPGPGGAWRPPDKREAIPRGVGRLEAVAMATS